jgi:LL-diaminopimelate aminotransferase
MIRINENYTKLKASYLFADIAKRVPPTSQANPAKPVIRLGIGDVTEPLPPVCIAALHAATDEMAGARPSRATAPSRATRSCARPSRSTTTRRAAADRADEIFVSDGAKCDCGNIQESSPPTSASPSPIRSIRSTSTPTSWPAAPAPNVDGRYEGITYLDSTPANGYVPAVFPARGRPDLPLLPQQSHRRRRHRRSSPPGSPTREEQGRHPLRLRLRGLHPRPADPALHLRDRGRARRGHRVPQLLQDRRLHRHALRLHRRAEDAHGLRRRRRPTPLHALWNRRHTTKFNGVSYPSRRPPPRSTPTPARSRRARSPTSTSATPKLIREAMTKLGFPCVGGDNAPYIWVNVGRDSWEFFDLLLNKARSSARPAPVSASAAKATCASAPSTAARTSSRPRPHRRRAEVSRLSRIAVAAGLSRAAISNLPIAASNLPVSA